MLTNLISKLAQTSTPKPSPVQTMMQQLAAKRKPGIQRPATQLSAMQGVTKRKQPRNMQSTLRGLFIKRKIAGRGQPVASSANQSPPTTDSY